jgi:outer membrane protein OmpA-like peptidoglycan-associated protein/tetratricopeptide (TPR) repeat protein
MQNIKQSWFVFFLAILCSYSAYSQDYKKKFVDAEYHFMYEEYDLALPIYLDIYKLDSANANLSYRIGVCYTFQNSPFEKRKAIPYLEYAVQHINKKYKEGSYLEKGAPPDAWYYLGSAYRDAMDFDKAIAAFKKFTQTVSVHSVYYIDYVKREMQCTENAKQIINNPIPIESQNLSEAINAPDDVQNCPVVSDDESVFVFTSGKKNIFSAGLGLDVSNGDYKLDDIFYAKKVDGKWGEPVNITKEIGASSQHRTVPVSINSNGTELYLVRDDNDDGNIYVSYLKNDKWTKMKELNKHINTKYWESHATITKDGNTLFFTSDRPGGFGGLDVYRSDKDDKGEWGPAVNLGPTINTIYDEETPFIIGDKDKYILYFSSQGHYSMGGFDVFYSTLLPNGKWTTPINIGYPLNTVGNDLFYVPKSDGQYMFFPLNGNERGDISKNNIYLAKINLPGIEVVEKKLKTDTEVVEKQLEKRNEVVEKQPKKSVVVTQVTLKGMIKLSDNSTELPNDATVLVFDSLKNIVVATVKPSLDSGYYEKSIPPGSYKITYTGSGYNTHTEYVFIPDNYANKEIVIDVMLQPMAVTKGEYYVIRSIFFEYGKFELKRESEIELQRLAQLMGKNTSLMVEIVGHTDALGSVQFNQKLSENRAKSAVDYLVSLGIDHSRFVAKGMGKNQFIAINKNPDGSDNPEGRQLNRRVEIKLLNTVPENVVVEDIQVPTPLRYRKDAKVKDTNIYSILLVQQQEKLLDVKDLNKLLSLAQTLKQDSLFKNVETPIKDNKIEDMLVFTAGEFSNKSDAMRILNLIIDQGFTEATIISANEIGNIKSQISRNYEQQVETSQNDIKKAYTIQIKAYTSPVEISMFTNLKGVNENYCNDGFYRYTYGNFNTRAEALKEKEQISENGYPDAFVISLEQFKQKIVDNVTFTIQLISSSTPIALITFKQLKGEVKEHIGNDGKFNYTYGTYKSINEARRNLEKIKKLGYQDALISNLSNF